MLHRLSDALGKLSFCFRVSAGITTFFRLLYYTKRFSWYKSKGGGRTGNPQKVRYVVMLNGQRCTIYLRTYAGDIDIFYEIFWRGVYRLPRITKEQPGIIADIGSNVGMSALYFATTYPGAQIVCLEPGPDNFSLLQQNCASFSNIIVRHAALLPKDGWATLQLADWEYNNQVLVAEGRDGAVAGISMNTLLQEYQLPQIDLLKMDIEGAEEAIFGEDTRWLQRVGQLLLEIHTSGEKSTVFNVLSAARFTITRLLQEGNPTNLYWAKKYPSPPSLFKNTQ